MTDPAHPSAVIVRIAGEEHALRANADPEYTRTCARFVDARIQEIREKSGLVETHRAAILAALSITDQLLKAREELDRLLRESAERDERLTRQVESALSGS